MFLDTLVQTLHSSLPRYDPAKEYLKSRYVSNEEISEYKLGYSRVISVQNDGSSDYETFMKETRDGRAFENKIVFPIYDIIGRAVGLFGRSIEAKEFKFYLTKEAKYTGAFFGLYQALPHIYLTGRVFIVEGPFDLLAFRKVYKNSIASMTAGISDAQYEILSFFVNSIVTVFDSDGPGKRANAEAAEKWSNVSSVELGYKDPDKCLKEKGSVDKFEKFVRDQVNKKLLF